MIRKVASRVPAKLSNYIGGTTVATVPEYISPTSNTTYSVLNPSTGEHLTTIPITNNDEINHCLSIAHTAQQNNWSVVSPRERSRILLNTAEILRTETQPLAELECLDTGRPISETLLDIRGAVDCLEYMAGISVTSSSVGQHILLNGSEPSSSFGYTRREPLGVTVGIGSWNYPLQSAIWKSAPALACGNSMVFKPSERTPLLALKLAEAYTKAGLPDGIFNVLYGDGTTTGAALVSHPLVSKVSFTGSVPTGTNVYQTAAQTMKPVTLELGGKSPLIIFNDAHLENAVAGAMMANWYSCGEVCSNGTRVFVQRSIYDAFCQRLLERTSKLVVGNPMDPQTHVGAMISEDHLQSVLQYVKLGLDEGGSILNGDDGGGERIRIRDGECEEGAFMKPAIFVNVQDDMTICRDEIFGPVMTILPFDTEEEVVRRSNDTPFGLAAGIYTRDLSKAHRLAASIEAGTLWINNYNLAPSELPWKGFKNSGLGQENGNASINYWTREKSIYCEMGDMYDCGYPM